MRNFKEIHVYFESGCIFNSSKGFFVVSIESASGRIVDSYGEVIKKCTKDEAKFRGLVHALEMAAELTFRRVIVFTNNDTLIKQLSGCCRVVDPRLICLNCRARILEKKFKKVIYRNLNEGKGTVEVIVFNKIAPK